MVSVCAAAHVDNEEQYVHSLEKFGDNCVSREEAEVGTAFLKFSAFTKELTALFKNLVREPDVSRTSSEDAGLTC